LSPREGIAKYPHSEDDNGQTERQFGDLVS